MMKRGWGLLGPAMSQRRERASLFSFPGLLAGLIALPMMAMTIAPSAGAETPQTASDARVEHDPGPPPMVEPPADLDRAAASAARMSGQLADNLALLFEKFERAEFILCLEGEITELGELALRDFRMPHIMVSRATSAALNPAGTCAQYEHVLGTLHTHPPTYPEDRGREASNCYLSRTDIVSWLEGSDYAYTAVMCGPRTWAWWHRSQVDERQVLAFPPENQLHQPESASSPTTTHGKR